MLVKIETLSIVLVKAWPLFDWRLVGKRTVVFCYADKVEIH